jgi:signal transduction histidine kinase
MTRNVLTVEIRHEQDVVLARQRARELGSLLGLDVREQTRLATAVSEIARNACTYAGGGRVEYQVEKSDVPTLIVRISDHGPGIPNLKAIFDGRYHSQTGMGMGIIGARRLVDSFDISTSPQGTAVLMGKRLPAGQAVTQQTLADATKALAQRTPQSLLEELQSQNQELIRALQESQERQQQVERLNLELEETNRGVLALYSELDEKAEALKRASELKSRFLSNMTHELRTPLNSIIMLSQVLLGGIEGPLAVAQIKPISLIQRGAEGMLDLVNDLLDLAKIEAGKVDVKPTHFTVNELFGALRGMFRPLLLGRDGQVELIFDFDAAEILPPLYTDEAKLAQVLRNSISNGLKFTRQGSVTVSVAEQPGGMVCFSVADTGIGISRQDQARLFEEFSQLDGPATGKGTGLGLSLARRLAELLGGHVHLKSDLGAGSTFYAAVSACYSEPAREGAGPDSHPTAATEEEALNA